MNKLYLPLLIGLCVSISLLIFFLAPRFPEYDRQALYVANILLAVLNGSAYLILHRKIQAERPQAFVNGVYSATLLRLMVCLGGIFIYAYAHKEQLHKPTIFAMMGLYLLYTGLETIIMSKAAKK